MNLFVYGTLMKGQRADWFLDGCECRGRYILKDFAMYDLGSFPGIVEKKGESTVGEVYTIRAEMLPFLDSYEGEGSLYLRKAVMVSNESESIKTYVYIYNNKTDEHDLMRTMWGAKPDEEVWYACYGSNLSEKRFSCYIEGGKCEENGKTYPGCTDKTRWSAETVMSFDGKLYFGNESGSWEGKGVAFFDPEAEGKTVMKLYKIKLSQLFDLRLMEGASPYWYGRIVCLGLKDDLPVYTLTSETRRPANAPCSSYIRLIIDAMRDELKLSREEMPDAVINALESN